ncbi:MAG: non-ribosomal peptide synthetase, partial [Actinomycetota bacterium]|nr:non-ribosomal peptide synthetase [Actinomycetota bacterium]
MAASLDSRMVLSDTVPGLVEAQVERTPDAPALVAGERTVTYAELDARADDVARHLHRLEVGPGTPVGVCVERTVEMAVGILAVLKAGGACLPLDPSYPAERLAFMLADAVPPVLLTQGGLAPRLPAYGGEVVLLDAGGDAVRRPGTPPARRGTPDTAAYVLYTSGSTGEPKGVLLPHRGLVNEITAAADLYRLGPGDRVLQFCSIGFDVSIEELFVTWASGATVVLRPEDVPILGPPWLDWLRRREITVLNLPTAYWHEWVRDLASMGERVPRSLSLVIVGGERALGAVYRAWLEVGGDGVRWLNAYGPTETSVMATVYEPSHGHTSTADSDPPIGRPIANTTVHVLDERGQPVVPGQAGELHIGGAGVALGYLNRPELTAERFVPDPSGDGPEARLYRTGDLVRHLPDGNLEFVGRLDDQVKVRGFRIECGEVETALAAHPRVAEAVVTARETRPGERLLVGYFVASGGDAPRGPELRRFLSGRLPAYMVPGAFVPLEALPLTPNGKVDRDALPAPARTRPELPNDWAPPGTATEQAVARIWSDVLGIEGIGADDDFFDLGGHSLQATQVVSRLRQAFDVDLPVRAIFESPTVRGLATALEGGGGG